MTEAKTIKQHSVGQELIFSACAAVEAVEQAQAILEAISNGIRDETVADRIRLSHIGTLTEIARQMLTEIKDELGDGLDAATGMKINNISER